MENTISGIEKAALLNKEIDFQESMLNQKSKVIRQTSEETGAETKIIAAEKKLIALVEIDGYEKSDTNQQVTYMYLFQRFLNDVVLSKENIFAESIHVTNIIPTSSGCYVIADGCDGKSAMEFLVKLTGGFQYIINDSNDALALRVSALFDECIPFMDLTKHKSYISNGMEKAEFNLSDGRYILEDDYRENNILSEAFASKVFSRNSLYVDKSLSAFIQNVQDKAKGVYEYEDVPDRHGVKRTITVLQGIK